ncbi:MAG: ABC transporter permease [Candidatus Methanoperedens sp.]|uniref:ABC transporter permease n=1 Tax=Candidatus Methanoperedens sp. BLZ2 TaxID=2035255 RepID=UPI000BE352F5|nr:ABC transporter permease [Candidatus Methanoperedens sp. BLZ2]KAB2945933.1 MAG: ABC transporter permease [Candidatus Methanoperedens sp.]MBZ0177487.1 ABC transporter permease [Candidatus Methanoperedens nitroreducens]MCX9079395.1 ABC transporter permease [Candidatus Methanoperedens sp.]
MKQNVRNVLVIAQKEFTDHLWSPRFVTLLSVFLLIIFSFSYKAASAGLNIFKMGFLDVSQIIAVFLPFLGMALGFDSVVKESKSSSLNVLLSHPVFRDNIITGKILGSLATLSLVIGISIIASIGTMLIISGVQINLLEIERILIFAILTFIYISTFVGISILLSIYSKNTASSLIYSVVIWINSIIVFSAIVAVLAAIITGQSYLDLGKNHQVLELNANLQTFSPIHHYAEAVSGVPSLSFGGVSLNSGSDRSLGIFDTRYTLDQWMYEYWTNLVVLITVPIVLFIASFVAFLRRDITM